MICRNCGELVADGPVCKVCGHDPVNRSGGKVDWRPFVIVGGVLGAILLSIGAAILMAVVGAVNVTNSFGPTSGGGHADASHLDWTDDFDDALDRAAAEDKAVLINFTGSDWCPWCWKLDADVFSKPAFSTWAEKNVILMKADFPRQTQLAPDIAAQNQELAQAYGVRGFPTILIVDKRGDPLGRLGYEAEVDVFLNKADRILAKD